MKIRFRKMHGAGNDFVLADDRDGRFPADDVEFLRRLGRRRTGVGCEGIVLLQASAEADVRMRFFNPDGAEQEMCGNGARCLARMAYESGAAPERMTIETRAGIVRAEVRGDGSVRLEMTPARDWRLGLEAGVGVPVDFAKVGVEHVVARFEDVDALDVETLGRRLRFHPLFAPGGTNANFVRVDADGGLTLRTYERGVEAETLACGTGATAAALTAARRGWTSLPVPVRCRGGTLIVEGSEERPALTGGAETTFVGEVEYGDRI